MLCLHSCCGTGQVGLVGSVLDAEPQPPIAGWCLPRGQGKSTLVAALGLYELMCGGEGATVVVVAVDERQAGIVFGIARRMVELNDELSTRVQVFKDRLVVPSRGASFQCLPSTPAGLEGHRLVRRQARPIWFRRPSGPTRRQPQAVPWPAHSCTTPTSPVGAVQVIVPSGCCWSRQPVQKVFKR